MWRSELFGSRAVFPKSVFIQQGEDTPQAGSTLGLPGGLRPGVLLARPDWVVAVCRECLLAHIARFELPDKSPVLVFLIIARFACLSLFLLSLQQCQWPEKLELILGSVELFLSFVRLEILYLCPHLIGLPQPWQETSSGFHHLIHTPDPQCPWPCPRLRPQRVRAQPELLPHLPGTWQV